jgi:hypothetical protein
MNWIALLLCITIAAILLAVVCALIVSGRISQAEERNG